MHETVPYNYPTCNSPSYPPLKKGIHLAKNELSVEPNPATTKITIKNIDQLFNLKIFNSMGQLILDKHVPEETTNLDIQNYLPGVYIIN